MKKRIAGGLVIGLGLLLLFSDVFGLGFQSVGRFVTLGEFWYMAHPESLNLSQAIIQRYIWAALWDPGITTVLLWPLWVILMGLGSALLWWSRR